MNFKRTTLQPNIEETFRIRSSSVTVLNAGDAALYIDFDRTATKDSLLIPAGYGRTFNLTQPVFDVHVFAEASTVVQIDNVR